MEALFIRVPFGGAVLQRTACRRRQRCGQRRIAVDSRTCSFEIFDNEQAVDIKLQSKRIDIDC